MVVLDCYQSPSPDFETHSFQTYDRKSRPWEAASLNAGPSVRGFGPWIANAGFVRKRPIGVGIHEADLKKEPESPGQLVERGHSIQKNESAIRHHWTTCFNKFLFSSLGTSIFTIFGREKVS